MRDPAYSRRKLFALWKATLLANGGGAEACPRWGGAKVLESAGRQVEPGGRVWKRKEERNCLRCREFQVGSLPPRRYRGSQVKKHWESPGGNAASFLQRLHSAKQQTRSKTPSARRYFSSYCASHIAMATSNMLLPLLPPNATLFTIFPRRMRWTRVETSPGEASVPAGR